LELLIHPILDQLTQLGLAGMAQAFAELEASGEGASLTHADWLGLLLIDAGLGHDLARPVILRHLGSPKQI
jgi:hypothetical protein